MLLGAIVLPATTALPALAGGSPAAVPTHPSVSAGVSKAAPPATSGAVAGTCLGTGSRGDVASTAASQPTSPPSPASGSSPLFNSQVTPYATYTGPYGYVAGGAAIRNSGYGQVNITWPGGSTSNLVAAYMIWSILNNSVPPAYATVNGANVTGTWTAYATPSPCWSPTYIYTFIAEVTPYVVNGINNITGIPSGVTNGADPWGVSPVAPLDDSLSLIAIFDNSSSSNIHQVTVYTGASPVGTPAPNFEDAQLNYSTANSSQAKTTYIVADGQLPGNSAIWNGTTIDADAFPGSDPHQSTATWSYGNLSDTKSYLVNVSVGSNNTTAEIASSGTDCFTWVGQVLSVGVPALKGPYKVDFQEQGLTNGATWSITTHSTTKSGTVANDTGSLSFSLGNGTYNYSAGAVAGFFGPAKTNYAVNGGPVFIRVIFHQVLYPVTFNATGLSTYQTWWVNVTNASEGIQENLSSYTPLGALFSLGNGTYNYSSGMIGLYLASPPTGTFTVNGAAVSVIVNFVPPPLYPVTFLEQGLPAGTYWGGSVDTNFGPYVNYTTNVSFTLELPNATIFVDYISPTQITGYYTEGYQYFEVSGGPVTVPINYTKLYTAGLVETGLATGTYWEAQLENATGSLYLGSYDAYLNFSVANGTYNFTVEPVWAYTATPVTGTLVIAGSNDSATIVFSLAPTYTVTFQEAGLAPGALWNIVLDLPNYTDVAQNSTTSTIVFQEPNGSYDFTPTAKGYEADPTFGYLAVDGANQTVSINFTQLFLVVFNETGLPSGNYWYVYFDYQYVGSYSSSAWLWTTNGSYTFDTYDFGSYTPSIATGTVNVTGGNQYVLIVYNSTTAPTVTVTFVETGLPAGTNWSVDYNDWSEFSTGSSINFTEPNGSFAFLVGYVEGYTPTPDSGLVNVTGVPVSQTIAFAQAAGTYAVTFVESGLPIGTTWYINISEEAPLAATVTSTGGTTLTVSLPNGTYSYTAASNNPSWTTTPTGGFTVSGTSQQISVPFSSSSTPRYEVQFVESHLPIGSTWYVNVTGEPGLVATVGSDSGTTLSLVLQNGTYDYTAATSATYWSTPSPGTFTVAGLAQNVSVPFSSSAPFPYTVTFTESNLPVGVTWYVNITGQPGLSATVSASSGTQLTTTLDNGSYQFTAASNSKNWTTSAGGPFSVAGSSVSIAVKFGTGGGSSSASSGLGSYWIWIVVGAILAALLLLILLAARRRKKQPPTAATPPAATSGTPPAPAGGSPPPSS